MKDTEAHKIIREMRDTAVADSENLAVRIDDLARDNFLDPTDIAEAHLDLLRKRYDRKVIEAEALALAVAKF